MRYVLWGILLIGGVAFGADFRNWIWTFVTVGIPNAWEDNVETRRCYRAILYAAWFAAVLPLIWTISALIIARWSIGIAEWYVLTAVFPSCAIFGALIAVAGIATDIVIGLSPLGGNSRQRLQRIRRGFQRLFAFGILWVIIVELIILLVGLEASLWALAVSVLSIVGYGVASYAFKLPFTWLEPFMTKTTLWTFFAVVSLVILMMFSPTRKIAARIGLNPGKFVHRGVVDVDAFTKADKAAQHKIAELCGPKAIQDITDAIAKAQTPKVVREQQEILKKRQQECL